MKRYVLDAWALLALMQGEEPCASQVKQLIEGAMEDEYILSMSLINLGEVYYIVGRTKGREEADETIETIRRLPIRMESAEEEIVLAAARLKMNHPISYTDAFAAATCQLLGGALVTGDPELLALEGIIALEKLR